MEKEDRMNLLYDFRDNNKFTLEALDKKIDQPVIDETKHYRLDTRAKLVERLEAKMHEQHEPISHLTSVI